MSTTNFLVNNYNKQRIPYEDRGKEYDKKRKREARQKELQLISEDLFFECASYKRLQLNKHQKENVKYLVKIFGNDFKRLHGKASSEAIILAFIFYIKLNEQPKIKLKDYKITSDYGLTDNIFEIIICKLADYFMKRMPIVPVETTSYNHEILSRKGGVK